MLPSLRTIVSWSLLSLLGATSQLAGQRGGHKSLTLSSTTCSRADSVLGAPKNEPKALRGEFFAGRDTVQVHAGDRRSGLEATLPASSSAGIDDPDARFYIIVAGTSKQTLFRSSASLRFTLTIDDSLYDLGPPHPGIPLSPAASVGFDVWIAPFILSKLVRAKTVEARLGGAAVETGDKFLASLRAGYRIALCGARPET
jgi:hypothetical protein